MKLLVILPAFNEVEMIGSVLAGVKQELKALEGIRAELVVVDDGSSDKTAQVAASKGAVVLRHLINRGLGGALQTGLAYARAEEADIVATFDADGQHEPADILPVIEPIVQGEAEVVIGSRFLKDDNQIAWSRRLVLWASNLVTWFLFGVRTSDSQSGFRAFSRLAVEKIRIRTQRMEVSSELFAQIKRHQLRLKEVPIKVYYTPYSRAKGQSNLNALRILVKLILRLAR